jgi:hypothetical protein
MRFVMLLSRFLFVLALASLSACEDGSSSDQARIRLLNVSADYNSLDLYTAGKDAETDTLSISAVAYGTVSGYAALDAGTYTIKLKRGGVTSTLQTLTGTNLAEDSDRTYLSYGSTGNFGVMQIGEDNDAPSNGYTKVQMFNTSEAGSLDVYLTESSTDIEDASPSFSAISSGTASAMTTLESGDYRLRVTGTGDAGDLRLDVPNIALANKGVLALVFTATRGGVLVNAMTIPQGAALTTYANAKVRLRGAVGISNGTRLTAQVGGVSVLNSASVGVLGNYVQIDAGATGVALAVDGASMPAANVGMTAGGEYTLLFWNDASGTRTTLINDDNRLPDAGKVKIRIMNGIASLAVPVTLAVDYSPIAEGVALGLASTFKQVDPSTGYQLDVTNSNTAANLLSRSSVSLQSAGVYTMFMSSNGTPAAGTLRKDR